jgi:uncharacterized protein (TIGR03435 family)
MRTTIATLLAAAALCAQPKSRLEFEVASVKQLPADADPTMPAGVHIDGAQIHIGRLAMKEFLRMAYQVKFYQIAGPDWIASQRYDISAKIPDGVTPDADNLGAMLQALLADRFHIKVHREQRDLPVYALITQPGGSKMTKVDDGAPPAKAFQVKAQGGASGVNIAYGPDSYFKFGDLKIEGRKLPMLYFVDVLGRFCDKPVVDMTDLQGRYDMDVPLSQTDYQSMLIRAGISAGVTMPPEALRFLETADSSLSFALKPLGLKLDSRKAPIEVVVVDSVLKQPTDN